MQQSYNLQSLTFSPELIELKQKLIQPSVLSSPQAYHNHIDTSKLKALKYKTPPREFQQESMLKELLQSIEVLEGGDQVKQKHKKMERYLERERYVFPPVKNIRKILKNNSEYKVKNEQLLKSQINKNLICYAPPQKKHQKKEQISKEDAIDQQIMSFLKKSKSNKRKVYYKPQQVRKGSMHKEATNSLHNNNERHFKSELKLSSQHLIRRNRTKTELKMHQSVEFNFFQLETQFNRLQYITLDQIYLARYDQRLTNIKRIPVVPKQQGLKAFLKVYEPVNEDIQIKQLLKSNFCSVQFSRNQVYVGEMIGKIRSGLGILFTNEASLQGQWKNNEMIKGVEITREGIYRGRYHQGKREGQGQFQWNNGELYVGNWLKGYQHGQGLWINQRGESYNGQWKNGKADGIGILIIKNTHNSKIARKYKGAFVNNKQQGFGRQNFANGDSYEGTYKQDKPSGKGVYIWANGSTYEGEFESGYRVGMGILKSSYNLIYKGQFQNDRPDGECEMVLPNGDTYHGMVRDGKKNGKGTLQIKKSKQVFNGYWQNDYFVDYDETNHNY